MPTPPRDVWQRAENLAGSALRSYERELRDTMRAAYRQIVGRMQETWAQAGGELTPGEARRYNRLGNLLDDIETNYGQALTNADRQSRRAVVREYQAEYYRRAWVMDRWVEMRLPWGAINRSAVERAITNPLSKLADSALLEADRTRALRRARRVITQTVLQGRSFFQASRIMQGAIDASYYDSIRVIRTEVGRVRGQAQVDNMKDAQEIGLDDARLQLIAVLDDRTRPQSARMDGQVSDEEGRFRYPDGRWYIKGQTGNPAWDINDRETTTPYLEDRPPEERIARMPGASRGDRIKNMSYRQWAEENGFTHNRYGEELFESAQATQDQPSP